MNGVLVNFVPRPARWIFHKQTVDRVKRQGMMLNSDKHCGSPSTMEGWKRYLTYISKKEGVTALRLGCANLHLLANNNGLLGVSWCVLP